MTTTPMKTPQVVPASTSTDKTPELHVWGRASLSGEVKISGAKNSALVLMTGAILAKGVCRLTNVPELADIKAMGQILSALGMKLKIDGDSLEIDATTGKCKVELADVERSNPLFRLRFNENLVAFETERYSSSPLIVKGAAAGPELAAAGIFADLLRLTRAFSSLQV